MTAWVNYSDPLCVTTDQGIAGHNWPDNRSVWHGLSEVTFTDGGHAGSVWYRDGGPRGMATELLEPRAFCTKGAFAFSFTGTTLIARVNVAYSWFTGATVKIDGVAPSTLGLLAHSDTLSCDAASYGLGSDAYVDVVLADGLTDAAHTLAVDINNGDAAKFFSLVGFKIGLLASQTLAKTGGWLISPATALLPQNTVTLTIANRGNFATAPAHYILNPTVTFPSGLVDASGNPLATLTADFLAPNTSISQAVLPSFTGQEVSGEVSFDFAMSGNYLDPAGSPVTYAYEGIPDGVSEIILFGGFHDFLTPTGHTRWYTTDASGIAGGRVDIHFVGDAITLTIQQSAGWGQLGVYTGGTTTLLHTLDCSPDLGGALLDTTFSGFGAGSHFITLRKTTNDGLFIVWVKAVWQRTDNFTEISETVTLTFAAQQPVAMPVTGFIVEDFDADFDQPTPNISDYTGTLAGAAEGAMRQNTRLRYTEVMSRFPTFAVCYQGGFRDTLSGYDILIVDPIAAHASDVLYWQSLGIKVFGYVASGEEVGFYSDRYDFTSELAPNSGSGPGGWAEYYMFARYGTTGADWVGTWTLPDKNGVWASFYVNPDPAFGWPARLEDFYAPQLFDGPLVVTDEVVTTRTVTIGSGPVIVFDTANAPLDIDDPITLKTMDGVTTYTEFADFTFDPKTGAVVLSTTIAPAVVSGDQLKISYTRKGHTMDGIFWDVVDTPDVFNSHTFEFGYAFVAGYAAEFATMLNTFKANHPDKLMISNRGFTILPDIIASCAGVMFESWLTSPTDITHLATTDYFRITDPDAIAYNDAVNEQLRELRMTHEFDVYSLNYALPDDAELLEYCRNQDAERGYLSWQSTITLDTPAHNTTVDTPGPPIVTNAFTRYITRKV